MGDVTYCEACDKPVAKGALVYTCSVDGGYDGVIHAACLGYPDDTDADGFVDEDGEPVDERPEPITFEG